MAGKNDNEEYITIEFDNGETKDCAVLGVFEVGDREYLAVLNEEAEEVYFYKYFETEEGYELLDLEDDDEYEAVSDAFDEVFYAED